MKRFVVTSRVARLGPGMVLALSKEQVARRAGRLRQVKGGYEPTALIDFKNGEEFGIVRGAEFLNKAMLQDITPKDEAEKKAGKEGGQQTTEPPAPGGQTQPREGASPQDQS
ncbi:MAG TPA: hypothetical protein VF188_09195 [Longimicrobiales bacterium]